MKEIERLNQLFSQKSSEVDDLRRELRNLREAEEELQNYKRKITTLEGRLRDADDDLSRRSQHINELKSQLAIIEAELSDSTKRASKADLVEQENNRLKATLDERNRLTEELKFNLQEFERNGIDKESILQQNRTLREEIERILDELAESTREAESLKAELGLTQNQLRTAQMKINDIESKLSSEIARGSGLQSQLRQLQNLNDDLESDLRDARSTILNLKDIEAKYDDLKRAHRALQEKADDLEKESDSWKSKNRLLNDLESKIGMLTTEYEKIITVLADRNKEIENWRAKYTQLELSLQKLADLEKRINILKEDNNNLRRALEEKSADLEEWTMRYGDIDGPAREIEDLQSKLESRKKDIKSLEMKLLEIKEDYSKEMGKLLHKYNEMDSRSKRLSTELDDKNEELIIYKQRNESFSNQLDTIKLQLETKFRGRLENVLGDITAKCDAEKSALENHLQQASLYISDLETRLTTTSADNDRLNQAYDDRRRENESLKIRLAGLEGNLSMLNTLQHSAGGDKSFLQTHQFYQSQSNQKF